MSGKHSRKFIDETKTACIVGGGGHKFKNILYYFFNGQVLM